MGRLAPDGNEPGRRITVIQTAKTTSTQMLRFGPQVAIVASLVREVLSEIPDADFIEIRAIKYEVEEPNERDVTPVPPGE